MKTSEICISNFSINVAYAILRTFRCSFLSIFIDKFESKVVKFDPLEETIELKIYKSWFFSISSQSISPLEFRPQKHKHQFSRQGVESRSNLVYSSHIKGEKIRLPLRRRDGENCAGSLNTVRALNHGSRPRSRPSAFIFARLVASCTEITPPPLCPTVPSPRARTPTECPISKGCTLHLVLPSFSFRFGNDAPPGLRAHLSQPGCSADESRCWRNWDKRQVSRDRCCVFEKSSCSSNLSQQSKDSRIIRFCPPRYVHKYAIPIRWFVWLLEKMLEGEDRKMLDRTLNWYRAREEEF